MRYFKCFIILIGLVSFSSPSISAQSRRTVVKGVVTDSLTREALSFAIVQVKGANITARADIFGEFSITLDQTLNSYEIHVVYLGYHDKTLRFEPGKVNSVKVAMASKSLSLDGVEVVGRRAKYRKKDNPGVELIRKLIARNSFTDPRTIHKQYGYERYEKMTISLHNFGENTKNKRLASLSEHRDTNQITGKPSLPFSIRERIYDTHIRDKSKKEQLIALRNEGIDERFSQENIDAYMGMLCEEIDIFQPSVYFMMRNFISPLSPIAPGYYKYFLEPDTTMYDGARCLELVFSPFDKSSLGFSGKMFVTADSTLFIRGVELSFPNSMNHNYTYNMFVNQTFVLGAKGERLITRDDVYFEFMLFSENDPLGFDIRHINMYSDYRFEVDPVKIAQIENTPDQYWIEKRPFPITPQEQSIGVLSQELRKIPSYRIVEMMGVLLTEEYIHLGKRGQVDLGPFFGIVGVNALEGVRLSLGGTTSPKLLPRIFLRGYAAYGFKDKTMKWNGGIEYSFIDKKSFSMEFPIHSVSFDYSYDVMKMGREAGVFSRDNIFSLLSRRVDSSLTYMRIYQLKYTRESKNNLSLYTTARHYIQYESDLMMFNPNNVLRETKMSEFKVRLRYAPGERLLENNVARRSIERNAPIFELSHIVGLKGVLGGEYSRNFTEFLFSKRFNLAPVGYVDAEFRGGVEWNEVPYIFLRQAPTNSSYIHRPKEFSLMLPMEFMYDSFGQWNVTWFLNGYVLNKIPLIKRLKWREVIGSKGLWGNLSSKNNPARNSNVIAFPQGSAAMGAEPYVELSIGVENIFKFFRVDYVRRLSYLDNSGAKQWGILVSAAMKF